MQQGGNEVWHLVQEELSPSGGSLGWDNLSDASGNQQPKLMAEENKQTNLTVRRVWLIRFLLPRLGIIVI